MNKNNGTLVIGWDFSKGNNRDTLIVMQGGRENKMKVVNAFYNEDAHAMWKMLTGKKIEEVSNL